MKIWILILTSALATVFAEEQDEAEGEGPFQQPLEPEDNRFVGYSGDSSYQWYRVIQVLPVTKSQVMVLRSLENRDDLEVKFWQEPGHPGNPVDIMVSPNDLSKVSRIIAGIGLKYKVLIMDVHDSIRNENSPHPGTLFSSYSGFDYGRYHQLHEIHRELYNLASRYPKLAKVFNIGTSYERRPMQAIKISSANGRSRKTFFYNCGIHAREWVSPATCMYMINQMLTKYGRDQAVTAMIDKMDWIILPVFNVDGYAHTWTQNGARLWRKTRKPSGFGCIGTDPNRNWDINWGGVGTSRNPCRDTYHGSRAFSEPEVEQVAKYLSSIRNVLVGYADIHSYSQMWMYPWGHTTTPPRDYREMDRVARTAVNALQRLYGTYYRFGSSSVVIYQTTGGSNDWVYSKLGVIYSYALELRDRGRYGFLLPSNQIIPTGKETFAAFKAMAHAMKI